MFWEGLHALPSQQNPEILNRYMSINSDGSGMGSSIILTIRIINKIRVKKFNQNIMSIDNQE